MNKKIVTFGEIMLRLSPPNVERICQTGQFQIHAGGSEANVAVSLAQFGHHAVHVTTLPENVLGERALQTLRGLGVDTRHIHRRRGRMGLNFCEKGYSQRPSYVLYDRVGSAFAECEEEDFDWPSILKNASWFHLSGITPALSSQCAKHAKRALLEANKKAIFTSLDLNYRKNLWPIGEASERLGELAEQCSLLITNEEDAAQLFEISAPENSIEEGELNREGYIQVARQLAERFHTQWVAITLRESDSASRNNWSGLLYCNSENQFAFSNLFKIQVKDRVGSGDAFAAGLIHGFLMQWEISQCIEFAAAAGCFKHSVEGDFNLASEQEITRLAAGNTSGRVER